MAAAVACAPSPNGAAVSSRCARSQIRLASALDRGCDLRAGDMVRECSRIRGAEQTQISVGRKKPRRPGAARLSHYIPGLIRRAHLLDLDVVRASCAHVAL